MTARTVRSAIRPAALAAVLAASGCGGDGDGDNKQSTGGATTPAAQEAGPDVAKVEACLLRSFAINEIRNVPGPEAQWVVGHGIFYDLDRPRAVALVELYRTTDLARAAAPKLAATPRANGGTGRGRSAGTLAIVDAKNASATDSAAVSRCSAP